MQAQGLGGAALAERMRPLLGLGEPPRFSCAVLGHDAPLAQPCRRPPDVVLPRVEQVAALSELVFVPPPDDCPPAFSLNRGPRIETGTFTPTTIDGPLWQGQS